MYKDGKWARAILAQQQDDGSWGYFHTLRTSSRATMTTEQALRRLLALGFTGEDAPMQKALAYLESCLSGERAIPDRREHSHSWEIFVPMMFAVWIRFLTPDHEPANVIARQWASILKQTFSAGAYDSDAYTTAYLEAFGIRPRGGRLVDFVTFYQLALVAGELDAKTENCLLDYVLHHKSGIYYLCTKPVLTLPTAFSSRETSFYLAVFELLSRYRHSREQLSFAVRWLQDHRNENGRWDIGPAGKDGVYFPLSDDWRTRARREEDCTVRITRLLTQLNADLPKHSS